MKYKWLLAVIVLLVLMGSQMKLENKNSAYHFDKNLPEQINKVTGKYVKIDEINPELIEMLVASEDKRFYRHSGFDLMGIGRALYTAAKAGEFHSGGSTLTQQLAKNLFLDQDKKLSRKVRELILALKLEKSYSKDEILEMYLNVVYFGEDAYGILDASEIYYQKTPIELSEEESATLIGLLPAPSLYNPVANLKLSQEKARAVLNLLGKDK